MSKLENEAAQSTTALGPLVGLAREDFVGAIALLLRETASDPATIVAPCQGFGDDVVKIMTGKSDLAPDPKDKRFMDPAWRYNPFSGRRAILSRGPEGHEELARPIWNSTRSSATGPTSSPDHHRRAGARPIP